MQAATGSLAGRMAGWGAAAGRQVLDLLLPPECLVCDRAVDAPGRLCPACFRTIGFISAPLCDRCGQGFSHAGEAAGGYGPFGHGGLVCRQCAGDPPPWRRARAALRYDDQARRLILALKHADRLELARPLAAMMARAGAALLAGCDVLVPVPLHRRRLAARRYNQAALLARAVGRAATRPVLPDALARTRATVSLGHLGRAARAETVAGVFSARPARLAAIAGRRVVLVDDVMTTGATAAACAQALSAAGALSIDVLVVARVPQPGG